MLLIDVSATTGAETSVWIPLLSVAVGATISAVVALILGWQTGKREQANRRSIAERQAISDLSSAVNVAMMAASSLKRYRGHPKRIAIENYPLKEEPTDLLDPLSSSIAQIHAAATLVSHRAASGECTRYATSLERALDAKNIAGTRAIIREANAQLRTCQREIENAAAAVDS